MLGLHEAFGLRRVVRVGLHFEALLELFPGVPVPHVARRSRSRRLVASSSLSVFSQVRCKSAAALATASRAARNRRNSGSWSRPSWKSTSVSGTSFTKSLGEQCDVIEQVSRRWRGGPRRAVNLISTQVSTTGDLQSAQAGSSGSLYLPRRAATSSQNATKIPSSCPRSAGCPTFPPTARKSRAPPRC